MRRPGSRGSWPLVAAAVLLALLSLLLGMQWKDSRTRADQLHAELRHLYAEAESLRTRAAQAEQRVAQLEDELRARSGPDARPRRVDSPR
jgi:cell division protein FtsB